METPRRPVLLVALALCCLCIGLLGAALSTRELSGMLGDREAVGLRVRDSQLFLYDGKYLMEPLSRLQRTDVDRLALQLGTELFDRRSVTIPLSIFNLIVCWLLVAGAYSSLRRRPYAIPLWRWACMANIPFAVLAMLVGFVLSGELMAQLGPQAAEALAAVSKRPVPLELEELWLMVRLQLMARALLHGLLVIFFGLTALYLTYRIPPGERITPP